jgi:hypothetical protein
MRGADWNEAEAYDLSWRQRLLLVAASVVVVVIAVAAAVAGAFVLGPGGLPFESTGTPRTPPTAFVASADPGDDGWGTGDETVVVQHDGGERVDPERLDLLVTTSGGGESAVSGVDWPNESWKVGETATYTGTIPENATLRLRWRSPDDDVAQILWAADVTDVDPVSLTTTAPTSDAAATDGNAAATDAGSATDGDAAATIDGATGPSARAVAFADRGHSPYAAQSHSLTAAASRSCAVGYETVAGRPPACP